MGTTSYKSNQDVKRSVFNFQTDKYFSINNNNKSSKYDYQASVESHLKYGILTWGGVHKCTLKN